MEYLSYLQENSLDISNLDNLNKNLIKEAKQALSEDKERFFDVMLKSDKTKQEILGQFHTQEELVEIVLDSLPDTFITDVISGAKVLDPSCGVGNFLITLIKKCKNQLLNNHEISDVSNFINKNIIPNLYGIEIDNTLCESLNHLFEFEFKGEINTPEILNFDSLLDEKAEEYFGQFDYVIGNPPWVEVKKLSKNIKNEIQEKYSLSNLYGAFYIQGYNFLSENGHLAYVTPRSFTGGKYYASLRQFIKSNTKINNILYFTNRNQKFHGGQVLQELVILSFQKTSSIDSYMATCIPCYDINDVTNTNSFFINSDELFSRHDNIMILSESQSKHDWLMKIANLNNFEEHGFRFSTGQVVTHRAKDFLSSSKRPGYYRLLYAHDIINESGKYTYRLKPDTKKPPYAKVYGMKNFDGSKKGQSESKESSIENWLNKYEEIIICRRRSHKGDKHRFVGLYLSNELKEKYFLDNSLNFICNENIKTSTPSLKSLFRILRSQTFEDFFTAISSNTQINKNDMYLFGIPDLNKETKALYKKLDATNSNNLSEVNKIVTELYEHL